MSPDTPWDADALRQALNDNYAQPEGPERNARAERLFAEIEQLGDTSLVIDGLDHLMQVYNYSSEADKMFVPFARLLRMWDDRPEDFGGRQVHSLFWMFKWVSSGMIDQPHIPLASIEKWQAEMEHRYRLAGHSERAVRQGELRIARHLGDMERAQRAYDAWQAADRDDKSDCHACELHAQGSWQAHRGDDEGALVSWRPVLESEFTCAHEPHAVLSASLLPLLRLGRAEEARANHLRGYRLVRTKESMRSATARHVEFCALTGNEARGLEILAERPAYFTDTGEPSSLLSYLEVTALLTDRLTALGHGEQSVPGPGSRSWTARELAVHARTEARAIAARFDARNGTPYFGEQSAERMDRAPLLERLPLGVRAARPVSVPRQASASAAKSTPVAGPAGLSELLAEARRLSEAQHPDATAAWAAVTAAADRGGVELDALERAESEEHRGMDPATPPAEAVGLFTSAAGLYETAGEPGRAASALARAAFCIGLDGRLGEALAAVQEPCDRSLALYAEGRSTARQTGRALLCRVRILNDMISDMRVREAAEAAVTSLDEAVQALLAFAEPERQDPGVGVVIGEALGHAGNVTAFRGDAAGAAQLYARAAEAYVQAGRPWYAVEAETQLAGVSRHLGDLETAERASRAALEHAAPFAAPGGRARLHLQLVETLADIGKLDEAADHALEAAHWADEAGESAGSGAYARHRLGGFLLQLGRTAEAAAVLESVLSDLTAEDHGDGVIVQTLWWLGDCCTALNEPREAAEHWLKAADIAQGWPEQRDHAMLANLAGQALYRARLDPQAELAYRRAGDLWRDLGDVHALVRTLRVRAWIAVREGQAGVGAARELMAAAATECESALAAAGSAGDADVLARLRAELADTHRQTGDLIASSCDEPEGPRRRAAYEEAVGFVLRAVAAFEEAGEDFTDLRTGAQLMAAWLHADLSDAAAARGLARAVLAVYADGDGEVPSSRCAEARAVLEQVGAA
ncbi:tetratricopeptide repeat protein [Streptomyces peucetius]|uniref:Tetratricopeptide repeat protein n=1 Tax=Streptomyces peucetius TaxID=1950 RepID=A0ABY6ICD0_STRPE|nr:tetratricopeptide repeat protein [Streptomyces peucetius]UYQ64638.1 tetratricopeptide repeat protein [Streptomyces peucetius]